MCLDCDYIEARGNVNPFVRVISHGKVAKLAVGTFWIRSGNRKAEFPNQLNKKFKRFPNCEKQWTVCRDVNTGTYPNMRYSDRTKIFWGFAKRIASIFPLLVFFSDGMQDLILIYCLWDYLGPGFSRVTGSGVWSIGFFIVSITNDVIGSPNAHVSLGG